MTEPPFSGTLEFKLGFRAFELSVVRDASAIYAYTPSWPYYHVASGEERTDPLQLDLRLLVLARPRADKNRMLGPTRKEPYWVPVSQLMMVGVLRTKIYESIHAEIDATAQSLDRRRRIDARLTVCELPEQI
jgi:hypothetical protein